MGNVVDYITPEPLDRWTQHLTPAELEWLEQLLAAMTEDGKQ